MPTINACLLRAISNLNGFSPGRWKVFLLLFVGYCGTISGTERDSLKLEASIEQLLEEAIPVLEQSTTDSLTIKEITKVDERTRGSGNGQISISFEDKSAEIGQYYDVFYDFILEGNRQVFKNIKSENGVLRITNVLPGHYSNFYIKRVQSEEKSPVYTSNLEVIHGREVLSRSSSRSSVCPSVSYVDCYGSIQTATNVGLNTFYNNSASYRPCGFGVGSTCEVTEIGRWHCIDGNKATPVAYNAFNTANYTGVGLTALQAARLKYLMCKYNIDQEGVAHAVWYITNTGGLNNLIYNDAVNNATVDGTEASLRFVKSETTTYQNMVVWECSSCSVGVNAGNDQSICGSGQVTLTANASSGKSPYTYQWSNQGQQMEQIYPAENAQVGGGAVIESVQSNYRGSGYVEFYAANGEYVQFQVNAPTRGEYSIRVRYTYNAVGIIGMKLAINNNVIPGGASFIGTGNDSNWEYLELGPYVFNQGSNTIRIESINFTGVDIDEISLFGSGATSQSGQTVNVNVTGSNTYNVTVTDANGCTATDQVAVFIQSSAPNPQNDSYQVCPGERKTLNVIANDGLITDPLIIIKTNPQNATASVNSSNQIVYQSSPNACGTDQFTYSICANKNSSCCSDATVSITLKATQGPAFTNVPSDVTVECEEDVPNTIAPSASNDCNQNITVELNEERVSTSSCNYQLIRTWTAKDCAGRTNSVTQRITVQDNEKPIINGIPTNLNVTVSCGNIPARPSSTLINATDNCDVNIAYNFNEESTQGIDPNNCNYYNYLITRTWTAEDACGNKTVNTQAIKVQDITPPTGNCFLNSEERECQGAIANENAINTWNTENIRTLELCYTDDCSNVTVTSNYDFNRLRNTCGSTGTIEVQYIIADNCGNESYLTSKYTIVDTQTPTFVGIPNDITVECDAVPVVPNVTVSDNCDDNITFDFRENSTQSTDPTSCEYYNYTLTRVWSAVDACNNELAETQVIVVRDTKAPEICCKELTLQLDENGQVSFNPEDLDCGASDNCSAITFSASKTTFNLNDVGQNTITLTVEDACGNKDQCTATVTVESFDLALRKEMAAGEDTRVYTGEEVTFTITVFNQGTLTASNVEVTDYIPNGFQLSDSNWSNNGNNTASTIIAGSIAPGASKSVNITLLVTKSTEGDLINRAEISDATAPAGFDNTDVDSSPDQVVGNDAGGVVNSGTDD